MGIETSHVRTRPARSRGSRQRFVPASVVLGVVGAALLLATPRFGNRYRHVGGACSSELVSRAPLWLWLVGLGCLVLANGAMTYVRGTKASDTPTNRVITRTLGVALVLGVIWFAFAQWGYVHSTCEY